MASPNGLTDQEKDVLYFLSKASKHYLKLGPSRCDSSEQREFTAFVHAAQSLVLSRPTLRGIGDDPNWDLEGYSNG